VGCYDNEYRLLDVSLFQQLSCKVLLYLTKVKSSHIHSAFHNTDCIKAASQ